MPVHLGSMGESVRTIVERRRGHDAARRRVRAQRAVQRRHASAGRHGHHAGVLVRHSANAGIRDAERDERRRWSPRMRGTIRVLRRLARPSRRHRRHHARARCRPIRTHVEEEGVLLDNVQLVAQGRFREARNARDPRLGPLSRAQRRAEPRRPARAGRGQREGRRRSCAHGRALRPATSCAPTWATCRTTPRKRCAACSAC